MIINDVEKITGLSKKSIRYYEEKKLISPKRQVNDYRDYSEEDIHRLKMIKLYRYIGFTIKEVEDLFKASEEDYKSILQNKINEIETNKEKQFYKQELCLEFLNKPLNEEMINEYIDTIDFYEGEEYQEIMNSMTFVPSLSQCIVFTLIFLGSILGLIINLVEKRYDILGIQIILAYIATRAIEVIWRNYYNSRKIDKEKVKAKNKETSFVIPMMLLSIIIVISLFVGIDIFYQTLCVPSEFIFYQLSHLSEFSLILLTMGLVITMIGYILGKYGVNRLGELNVIYRFIHRIPKSIFTLMVILLMIVYYMCLSSYCVITDTQIIYHSPLHPQGIIYKYQDVESVDVSIKRGLLNYKIHVDGHSFTFSQPTTNGEQRYDDTYIELEDFDQALMNYGIKKNSSLKNISKVDMDQVYIDRFKRIINNQPEGK